MNDNQLIKQIGIIHSSLKKLEDCPLQENEGAPDALLEIFPAFAEGLHTLSVGAEIILITWFHKANREVVQTYRRNNKDMPSVGVFTTRSPDRPNPIGLHKVKVLEIFPDGKLKVFPLEVLDDTPVIDIKPVI